MNKIFYIGLWGVVLVSLLSGCRKLEEIPYSSIFMEQFYKTPADAEAAINGVYNDMAGLYAGPSALLVPDFSADQVYPRPVVGRNTLTLFIYDPEYSVQSSFDRVAESPLNIWEKSYAGIEKANWVLEKVPAIEMTGSRKKEILGEAFFLRAFFHWMLAKNFGEIPVKITPSRSLEEAYVGKSSKTAIYRQIYADLDSAITNLNIYSPAGTVKGRPSKEAAMALYAKAALYNEDWPTALQKAKLVLESGKYSLLADVYDIYDVNKEDAARQENIWAFEAEREKPGNSSSLLSLYGPASSAGPAYGKSTFGSIFAYPAFYNSFDAGDKRKEKLMATSYINKSGAVVPRNKITPITPDAVLVNKYMDANTIGSATNCNIPILRLADVYLIAAEAENRMNGPAEAYSYLNAVHKRATGANVAAGLSQPAFTDAVLQERSWELFAEGDRWYDLSRTGKFLSVIPAAVNDVYPARNVQPKHKYFPIPQLEINANPKLEQNPDWK
ncbi:RagB/SusD family nutrient uptake outer membrane protein [Niabella sp.]|uniref:RagB/SusD family nutrient uptake outer membrane protein n=1 Tax=Niabella sp. TaxID=1962976 RepID=UPI00260E9BB7|nr:RagB/SusD family nutrient uptake outer membrane protein [Niabella sp.]